MLDGGKRVRATPLVEWKPLHIRARFSQDSSSDLSPAVSPLRLDFFPVPVRRSREKRSGRASRLIPSRV